MLTSLVDDIIEDFEEAFKVLREFEAKEAEQASSLAGKASEAVGALAEKAGATEKTEHPHRPKVIHNPSSVHFVH
jgi:hypothetical protein